MTTYTCKLTPAQADALRQWMAAHQFEWRKVPHARFAGQKDKVSVTVYESGKLVVQGKGTQEFVEFVLEPEILKQARLGYEAELNPELLVPRIGIDESGKGDFFGPLCVAGVYVNEAVIRNWLQSDIRDSKRVSSDARIAELAKLIRQTEGCVWDVVVVGNEAYNRLYARMGNLNKLLAWAHARVLENLMGRRYRMNPPPARAISDQFAKHKHVVGRALMSLGREIELVQRHKAEEDLAVAAASILARNEFVTRLKKLSEEYGITLPKGASAEVEKAARELIQKHGPEVLSKVAKLHFRTAAKVTARAGSDTQAAASED